MPFTFRRLEIPEVIAIEAKRFADKRGSFFESYRESSLAVGGIAQRFTQDNVSYSQRGVLRGLHYQKMPAAQGKLIAVVSGEIFDVAVDIRRGSPTYGRWVGLTLSSTQFEQLVYVPPGFAHGFCTRSDEAVVLYKTTAAYAPNMERGIRWNDPSLNIAWPIAAPVLNDRDAALPGLAEADNNFEYSP